MSANFVQSGKLRAIALAAVRTRARVAFWRAGPRLFINSVPKSGTHLLTSELGRFPGLQNSHLHVLTRKVNRRAEHAEHLIEFEADAAGFLRYARSVRGGQYFSAHLPYDAALAETLVSEAMRTLFVVRDPRDLLVSQFHYIVGLRRHHLHEQVMALPDDVARYAALAFGMAGTPPAPSLAHRLEAFSGWLKIPEVLVIRFEDLVGVRGGGDEATKARTLRSIAEHCGLTPDGIEDRAATNAGPTPTLRKGKANAWRGEIPDSVVDRLHSESGDLIRAYGYSIP